LDPIFKSFFKEAATLVKTGAADKEWEYYYHGSPIQGLKELRPDKAMTYVPGKESKKHLFLAHEPDYAATYGLQKGKLGLVSGSRSRFGSFKETKYVRVHPEQVPMLDKPMSVYKVHWKMPDGRHLASDEDALYNELAVDHPVPVVEEMKFKSVRDALKHHNYDIEVGTSWKDAVKITGRK
jgi:hypothetical protein